MFTLFQIFGHLAFIKKQITEIIFTGWLRQWRCSSQHYFSYLFLDKGQVAENLKQSKHSVLVTGKNLKDLVCPPEFVNVPLKFR